MISRAPSKAPKDLIKRLMTVDPRSRCTLQQVKAHEWMVGEWKQVPKDKKEEETKEEEEHITDGKKEENNSNGKDLATGADDEADDCKQQTTKIRFGVIDDALLLICVTCDVMMWCDAADAAASALFWRGHLRGNSLCKKKLAL
eukprot:jgi/Bigna1/81375/fgenesh1_pg.80_\